MKTLIVEDEFTSRAILLKFLSKYGECAVAVDGEEALNAIAEAHSSGLPYDLICLDILMPGLDGNEVLKAIREREARQGIIGTQGVKIIMTSGERDPKIIMKSFREGCEAYLAKPINHVKLVDELNQLELIKKK